MPGGQQRGYTMDNSSEEATNANLAEMHSCLDVND